MAKASANASQIETQVLSYFTRLLATDLTTGKRRDGAEELVAAMNSRLSEAPRQRRISADHVAMRHALNDIVRKLSDNTSV